MRHHRNAGVFFQWCSLCANTWIQQMATLFLLHHNRLLGNPPVRYGCIDRTLRNENSHQTQVWVMTMWLIVAMVIWPLRYRLTVREKGASHVESTGENEWERRGTGGEEEGERKGALMFHVGEEEGEKSPLNVRSIWCPLICSRNGLHPLRLSPLILQLLVFKMDFKRTPVNITKVIASSEGLFSLFRLL